MNILLTILITLAGIVSLALLVALILPKHYSVEVSVIVNKPKDEVHHYISLLRNQLRYSEWLNVDPGLVAKVEGVDGTVGAVLSWESHHENKNKNVGMGELEIKSMDEKVIDVELRLIKPMPANCKLIHRIEKYRENQTHLFCTFHAYAKFPINLPSHVLGIPFIRKKQLKSLNNVKSILEQPGISSQSYLKAEV